MSENKITTAYHISDKNLSVLRPGTHGDYGAAVYLALDAHKLVSEYLNPKSSRRWKKVRRLIRVGESGFVDFDVYRRQLDEQCGVKPGNTSCARHHLIEYIRSHGPQTAQHLKQYLSYSFPKSEVTSKLVNRLACKSIEMKEEEYWPEYRLYKVQVDKKARIIDMTRPLKEQGFSSLEPEQLCALYRLDSFSFDSSDSKNRQAMIDFVNQVAYGVSSPYSYDSPEYKDAFEKRKKLGETLEVWQKNADKHEAEYMMLLSDPAHVDFETKELKQKRLEVRKDEEQLKGLIKQSVEMLTQVALDTVPSQFVSERFNEAVPFDGKLVYDNDFRMHYLVIKNPDVVSLQSYQVVLKDDKLVEDLSLAPVRPIERPPHKNPNKQNGNDISLLAAMGCAR